MVDVFISTLSNMQLKEILGVFLIVAVTNDNRVSSQQGVIISSDEFFARDPGRPSARQDPQVTPSVRQVGSRRRTRDPRKPTRCTRRQIRNGRCTTTSTTRPDQPTRPSQPTRSSTDDITRQGVQQADNIQEVRSEIERFIEDDHEMIPNLLQLVFHTCMGGCDGCINFDEDANNGLRDTYRVIRQFWSSRASILTLADMIVLMASEAIEIGMDKPGGPGVVSVSFTTGRSTCDDPDNYNKQLTFPHGDKMDDVEILQEEFGLSRKLAIALLGAHSVGRCHMENSGFAGRWDNTELTLDNHYYKSLLGTNWRSTFVQRQHQWNSTNGENSRMMLNSDLALLKSFTFNNNGRPSCTPAKQCEDSTDAPQVKIYGRDDQVWAEDFIDAFLQMVNKDI